MSIGWLVGRSAGHCLCLHVFSRTVAVVDTKHGYMSMQQALGTVRVWSGIVKEQHFYGAGCAFLVKAESGGYQTWICG